MKGMLLGLALLVAAAPATVRAAPVVVEQVRDDDEAGLDLRWEPGPGAPASLLLAVPPRRVARVAAATSLGEPVAPAAVRVIDGRARRLRIAHLVLDPSELTPAQLGAGVLIHVAYDPATSEATSVAARAEGRSAFVELGASPRRFSSLAPDAAALQLELDALRSLRFLDDEAARRRLRDTLSDPASWPAIEPAPAGGTLRRLAPAAGPAFRIDEGRVVLRVDREGVYRLTGADLEALGVDLSATPVADLRLTSRVGTAAAELPLRVHDEDLDGVLDPADWLDVWAYPLTGEVNAGLFEGGNFTDVNAFFLDALPGSRRRMDERDATPVAGSPAPAEFLQATRAEQDAVFLGNHRTGLPDVEHFYSCPSLITPDASARTVQVPLPGLATASPLRAAVRVRLLSRTDLPALSPDHESEVALGTAVVSVQQADGPSVVDHDARDLSPALLSDPLAVTIRLPGIAPGNVERAELDWIAVDYPRALVAAGGRLELGMDGPASVTVRGLPLGGDVLVLDVTDAAFPVALTGVARAGDAATFQAEPGPRRYAVASTLATPLPPRALEFLPRSTLRDPIACDVLVVGPRAWVSPPLPALSRWRAMREAEGLAVRLASTEEIIDEFGDGQFSPFATSRLLQHALSAWTRAPRWVLLLGDANVDHRNVLQDRVLMPGDCSDAPDPCGTNEPGWVQHVPTFIVDKPEDQVYLGYFASDTILSLVAGSDWIPDVALGRLPARSASEIEAMLDKIVAYEGARAAPPAWSRRAIAVADAFRPGEEVMEESQRRALAALPPCYGRQELFYQSGYGATNPQALTDDLIAAWTSPSDGAGVLSYVGHGSTFSWSTAPLLTNAGSSCRDDVPRTESPSGSEPFVLNANCVTGAFTNLVAPSLLEALVRAPEGGAIAAFGPTGITDLAFAEPIVRAFYDAIYGPDGRGLRAGDVVRATQDAALAGAAAAGSTDELLGNALLGDPSLRLLVPFGPPAGDLRATASAGQVRLDWTAVGGADEIHVMRSDAGIDGPYADVSGAITGTTWTDRAVSNATLYHYAIEPRAACLPGRWSPRATARPCDPALAPAEPSNAEVFPTDCAGEALITWTPSASPGIEHVVRLWDGPRLHRELRVAGSFTDLRDVPMFVTFDVEVVAADACGAESAPATASLLVTCPAEIDAPAWIDDLRVRRAGAELELTWGAVRTLRSGAPFTPAGYALHRATDAAFDAAAARIGTVASAGATLPLAGAALEFFAVSAEGPGTSGPVAYDAPQGVRGLGARWLDATRAEVSWTATDRDVRGERIAVDRYEVHASPSPLTRAEIDARAPDAVVTSSPAVLDRSLGSRYRVIVVDAHGNRSAW